MKIKTGIFGGSFNPIHIGHLALANYLCEFEGLDELWFMASPQNPLKRSNDMLDDHIRLELARIATKDYPKFQVSDLEFHLPKPSYTIHTLDTLKNKYPEREFYLIIGADNWVVFDKWKDSSRILQENKLLIYPRKGFYIDEEALPSNVRLVQAPLMEISSTFIRDSIRKGKDVRFFLPESIRETAIQLLSNTTASQ